MQTTTCQLSWRDEHANSAAFLDAIQGNPPHDQIQTQHHADQILAESKLY